MKSVRPWLFSLAVGCVFFALSPGLVRAELSRERGAIYLRDFMAPGQVAILKVVHPAPIFYQLDGKRKLGTLVVGYDAEIIGISDKAYQVRAKATHADVSGWVTPKAFESHRGADFVRILRELHERQLLVKDLIEQKKIALGMTAREVCMSLGEPDRVSSTVDAEGRQETYEFICYERIAQRTTAFDLYGNPYQTVTFIKVETGKTVVELEKDSVTRISNTEGAPNLNAAVIIAPPPILVF